MRKILSFVLVTCSCIILGAGTAIAADGVKIDNTNFPDDYLQQKVKEFDTNKDGVLQNAELSKVTNLQLYKFLEPDDVDTEDGDEEYPNYKKEDFRFDCKGLENFTNLKKLYIFLYGGITKEGKHYPSTISNFESVYGLRNLEKLQICSSDMKEFDVSKFSSLKNLYLSDVESLKKINLKSKTLKDIYLGSTKSLKAVDFSKAKNLKKIELSGNGCKTIKFGKNNKQIRNFKIYESNVKGIKLVNFDKLENLKDISLTKVKINNLDLSKNKKLKSVYMDYVPMKKLDLSKNKKLKEILLEGKKTKKVVLPKNNKVEFIRWTEAKMKKLAIENMNPKAVKTLIVFGNKIKKLDLSKYKKLTYVCVDKKVTVKLNKTVKKDIINRN